MSSSAAEAEAAALTEFVEWREDIVSQERGSRVVHYFLEDSTGKSHLAVVGTERSLRHMIYVVSEDFHHSYCADKSGASNTKWRSRREVVDWLTSFLCGRINSQDHSRAVKKSVAHNLGAKLTSNGHNETGGFLYKHVDFGRNLKGRCSDIEWSGSSWTCGKQLKHYEAFCCNGTTIYAHSFVLVLSEEENQYLAYLEDMYEDKKGQKKVKVRWFHQDQEFACTIPPPTPHPNEVFITPYSQVISAESVDDVATILSPEHYEKCLASSSYTSSSELHFCFRQYNKKKFKLFDVTSLRGYFNQSVLSSLDICSVSGEEQFGIGSAMRPARPKRMGFVKSHQCIVKDPLVIKMSSYASHMKNFLPATQNMGCDMTVKRPLSVKFIGPKNVPKLPFKVDEKIELLCQDSGIRGCWFKCTVLRVSHRSLKVRYDDVQNDDDCGNLEEWVPTFRLAASDKLGMRLSGRFTIRPSPNYDFLPENTALQVGAAVDAWWNDGWWEGVVVGMECCGDDDMQVYIPGEAFFISCQRKRIRISKDWSGSRWVDIDPKPDILSLLSSASLGAKPIKVSAKGAESGSSAPSGREAAAMQPKLNEDGKQTEENEEDNQTEGSFRSKANGSSDCDKYSSTRKRCREAYEGRFEGALDLGGELKASN